MARVNGKDIFETVNCPTCNGEATITDVDGKWMVVCCCQGCGAISPVFFQKIYFWGLKKHEKKFERAYKQFQHIIGRFTY